LPFKCNLQRYSEGLCEGQWGKLLGTSLLVVGYMLKV
jgi:hypothetical protein